MSKNGVSFWALLKFLSAHILEQHPTHDYWLMPSQQNIYFTPPTPNPRRNVKWTKSSTLQKGGRTSSQGIFLGLGLRSLLRPPPPGGIPASSL
ncbi:hypothetical protein LZ31DRAFT_549138 [Colletotrichum somersetense]|nr:hypothetical protein LZ31DRAFT_549138 [Colletotrichum somersetense]